MSLANEQRKLTNNIDSYAAWNNEFHKKLKMKYYSDDIDERIVNAELKNIIDNDYNKRYFPNTAVGVPTLKTLVDDRKLQEELSKPSKLYVDPKFDRFKSFQEQYIDSNPNKFNLIQYFRDNQNRNFDEILYDKINKKIYSRNEPFNKVLDELTKNYQNPQINKTELKNNLSDFIKEYIKSNKETNLSNFINETIEKAKSDIIEDIESQDSLAKKNKKEEKQARKQLNLDIDTTFEDEEQKRDYVDSLDNPKNEADYEEKKSSPTSSIGTSATTDAASSMIPGTSIADQYGQELSNTEYADFLSKKTGEAKKADLFEVYKQRNNEPLKIIKKGIPYVITFSTSGKTASIAEDKPKAAKNTASVSDLDLVIEEYLRPKKVRNITAPNVDPRLVSEFASTGLMDSKMSVKQLKNRFEILKGEILTGNDNPQIISELKKISKELFNLGLLKTHL
jgi:hypothetical protein